ncbi:M16 family metallopeptidase [Sphingobacterium athyrii]|uniref:M16 family metallopeptidase n=1 Tax=Sphingobacterium athyrii TaxID=2152717 RepID=UPI0028AC6A58|nr:insulinase family protein [Sphingobacterium athyrii]
MNIKKILVGVCVYLVSVNVTFGQDLPLDTTVRKGVLPNGFRYIIKANRFPENRAVLYLANKVGSILEEESERGLAHFMEHMNFKGTTHFPKNALIDYLEKAGVKFGADLNAYTSYDETVYQLPLPTDDQELWKNGMQIMRDWAAEATLDSDEFEKERGVILEEKRLQQTAAGRMREKYMPTLYNYSRYADRLPIGLDDVIEHADISVIRGFYKKWYRPDLQVLIVVGDIDVGQVESQIISLFSDLKAEKKEPERKKYTIPLIDSTRFVASKDKEFSNINIDIVFKRKATKVIDKTSFKAALVADLANSLMASRIQEMMRQGSKSFTGLSMGASAFIADLTSFNVRVSLSPDKIQEGFIVAWTEVERINRHGFTPEEMKDVKERLVARINMQEKEKDKISSSSLMEDYLNYFLNGDTYLSIDQKIKLTREALSQVDVADINRYISNYLAEKDQVIIVLGTDKAGLELPDKSAITSWLRRVSEAEIKPYQQDRKDVQLFDKMPQAGKIVQEQNVPALALYHWKLSNGVKVYAKPTTFKNDEILFTAFSPGGSSLYSDTDYYSSANAATFVVNSGLGTMNSSQLSQFLNAKAVQVMPYIGEREEGINGASIGKDLDTGLGLLHLYMTGSNLDTARFRVIMERSKEALKNRADDPKRAFADTIGNILGNYQFRRQPASLATLEQIKVDRVHPIFKERFSNAADFTFVFVGNFNLDSLKLLTVKYLGSLPSGKGTEKAKDLGIRVPEGNVRRDLRVGKGEKGIVQMVYSGKYSFDEQNNQYLDALKACIDFRLIERLRKQESGVYSPRVQLTKTKQPLGFYAIVINFECDPDRKEALIKAVEEELVKIKTEGLIQEELDKFVAEETRSYELSSKTNQFWLSYLKGQLNNQEPMQSVLTYPGQLKKQRLANLNSAVGKLLNLNNKIIVTLSPEEK